MLRSLSFAVGALIYAASTAAFAEDVETIANSIGMKMVLLPAGDFHRGTPDGDSEGEGDEKPEIRIRVKKPFYLGQTEVTQAQWQAVMGTTPWSGQPNVKEGPDYAASVISYNDAETFCRKLSKKEGKTYRLPTEAEWEYACRAGTTTRYSFGDDAALLDQHAWYITNSGGHAHAVATKKPNPFGLYDMHGNVWEWCTDSYGEKQNEKPRTDDAGIRVYHGGSWDSTPENCGSATRYFSVPQNGMIYFGFRPALDNDKRKKSQKAKS